MAQQSLSGTEWRDLAKISDEMCDWKSLYAGP